MQRHSQNPHGTQDRPAQLTELLRERILLLDGATGTLIQGWKFGESRCRGVNFATSAVSMNLLMTCVYLPIFLVVTV